MLNLHLLTKNSASLLGGPCHITKSPPRARTMLRTCVKPCRIHKFSIFLSFIHLTKKIRILSKYAYQMVLSLPPPQIFHTSWKTLWRKRICSAVSISWITYICTGLVNIQNNSHNFFEIEIWTSCGYWLFFMKYIIWIVNKVEEIVLKIHWVSILSL